MVIMPNTKKPQTRVKRRYIYLINQLLDEEGSHRRVADKLGIDRSYVTKMLDGDREDGDVGADLVECAIKNLTLKPSFFFDNYSGERSYRRYLDTKPDDEVIQELRSQVEELRSEVARIKRRSRSTPSKKPK